MEYCKRCNNEMRIIEKFGENFAILWHCEPCNLTLPNFIECPHSFVKAIYQYESGYEHVCSKCKYCYKTQKVYKRKDVNLDELPVIKVQDQDSLPYWAKWTRANKKFNLKIEEINLENKKKSNAWTIQQWYYGYLDSPQWAHKRNLVFKRAEGKCERCSKKAVMVHHKTYARVGYEDLEDLMAVCFHCHSLEHSENRNLNVVSQFKIHDIK
ncbi:HNH endonuclease [Aestuariibaculum sp. M13]|uniref:HNH endonuclease n=1 Tax=Aestuariibaculum sp. M13 TaxID=2967132 RepID=UPI002159EDEE|nr:HNH endonuclease [Aestuariibaculum sp. M13]MCR8666220.1 HNH endonuclease [Aestuariibaculum sp. M13]